MFLASLHFKFQKLDGLVFMLVQDAFWVTVIAEDGDQFHMSRSAVEYVYVAIATQV